MKSIMCLLETLDDKQIWIVEDEEIFRYKLRFILKVQPSYNTYIKDINEAIVPSFLYRDYEFEEQRTDKTGRKYLYYREISV